MNKLGGVAPSELYTWVRPYGIFPTINRHTR